MRKTNRKPGKLLKEFKTMDLGEVSVFTCRHGFVARRNKPPAKTFDVVAFIASTPFELTCREFGIEIVEPEAI